MNNITNKEPILKYCRNITSEHGEDGIIEKIFDIIGDESKWCIELGALNGKHGSNVWHLVKDLKWSSVLIEADRTYFEKLQQEYSGIQNAYCINTFVSFEGEQSLDRVLSQTPIPRVPDLFSLDIDGCDYHLWDSMTEYRPRVMLVEFNPSIPNDVTFVQPRDMAVFQGSSLRAFVELGKRKGYELVCVSHGNAFFVVKELFSKFCIDNNSIEELHKDHSYETRLFQLYDGTLCIAGCDRLIWHNIPIDIKKLQVLPARNRRYTARIDKRAIMRSVKYWIRKLPFYAFLQRLRSFVRFR